MPYVLIILLLLSACAPIKQSYLAQQSNCVPIAVDHTPLDLCFLTVANRYNYNERNLYFLVDDMSIERIPALGDGFETVELLVSPSRRYAAIIENAGEGHGIFFVTDLNRVRAHKEPQRCPGIQAYPHDFYDLQWHGDILHFTTHSDLLNPTTSTVEPERLPTYHYRLSPAQACRLEASN